MPTIDPSEEVVRLRRLASELAEQLLRHEDPIGESGAGDWFGHLRAEETYLSRLREINGG